MRTRKTTSVSSAQITELLLEEVVMAVILITVAGHETTANLLGAGLVTLLTPDEEGARIATADLLVETRESVAVKAFWLWWPPLTATPQRMSRV